MSIQITEASFDHHLAEIEQLIFRRELGPAAEQLTALGRFAPEHPVVYILGMRLAEAAGNAPAALKSAERAVACAPTWPGGLLELAALLSRQNQPTLAVQRAREAVALAPSDVTVLSHAIDIAQHFRDFPAAFPWLQSLAAAQPQNLEVQRLVGRNLAHQGRWAEAVVAFNGLVDANAEDVAARGDRMSAAFGAGETAIAQSDATWLLARDSDNEDLRFWHQRVHGHTPSAQPKTLVTNLFDSYANTFDMHLVRGLKYDMPKRVAEIVREKHPELRINLLDLGCGTGLVGVYLGRPQGALIGVDLSEKMIEQAARHGLYDRFHQVDVGEALAATPDALYHVITACDVFIYVGDLGAAIPNAFRILRPDGDFIFSCEAAEESGPAFVLRSSMRFAHQQADIEAQCRAAGFDEVTVERIDLRMENDKPVGGFYVVAHKPA